MVSPGLHPRHQEYTFFLLSKAVGTQELNKKGGGKTKPQHGKTF